MKESKLHKFIFLWKQLILIAMLFILCTEKGSSNADSISSKNGQKQIVIISSSDCQYRQQIILSMKEHVEEVLSTVKCMEYQLDDIYGEKSLKVFEDIATNLPHLIVSFGRAATHFALKMFPNIPLIFSADCSNEKHILEQYNQINTSNATGTLMFVPVKRKLELLTQMFPGLSRIGALYTQSSRNYAEKAHSAADSLNLEFVEKEVSSDNDAQKALIILKYTSDILLLMPDNDISPENSMKQVLSEARKLKIPVIGVSSSSVQAGALLALEPDYMQCGKQTGNLIKRFMDGQNPAQCKFYEPEKYNYFLNLKTANNLEIEVTDTVRDGAFQTF